MPAGKIPTVIQSNIRTAPLNRFAYIACSSHRNFLLASKGCRALGLAIYFRQNCFGLTAEDTDDYRILRHIPSLCKAHIRRLCLPYYLNDLPCLIVDTAAPLANFFPSLRELQLPVLRFRRYRGPGGATFRSCIDIGVAAERGKLDMYRRYKSAWPGLKILQDLWFQVSAYDIDGLFNLLINFTVTWQPIYGIRANIPTIDADMTITQARKRLNSTNWRFGVHPDAIQLKEEVQSTKLIADWEEIRKTL